MTDREMQIAEMEAIIIRSHCDNPISKDCYGECEYCIAKDLYDAGYRKQSDDMVTVVRCRECRYWQDNNGGYPHEECRWWKNETPDADDYCSYGARMKGGELDAYNL